MKLTNDESLHDAFERFLEDLIETANASDPANATPDCVASSIVPERFDILCGREKITHLHIGNKVFRRIVEWNRERYQTATLREDKTRMTVELVERLRKLRPGGRFLKQDTDTGEWFEVGDEYAREKVSHALRSAKDPNRPRAKKKRRIVPRVHTQKENAIFESILGDQQQIFEALVNSR